jgi:hypothetical protein
MPFYSEFDKYYTAFSKFVESKHVDGTNIKHLLKIAKQESEVLEMFREVMGGDSKVLSISIAKNAIKKHLTDLNKVNQKWKEKLDSLITSKIALEKSIKISMVKGDTTKVDKRKDKLKETDEMIAEAKRKCANLPSLPELDDGKTFEPDIKTKPSLDIEDSNNITKIIRKIPGMSKVVTYHTQELSLYKLVSAGRMNKYYQIEPAWTQIAILVDNFIRNEMGCDEVAERFLKDYSSYYMTAGNPLTTVVRIQEYNQMNRASRPHFFEMPSIIKEHFHEVEFFTHFIYYTSGFNFQDQWPKVENYKNFLMIYSKINPKATYWSGTVKRNGDNGLNYASIMRDSNLEKEVLDEVINYIKMSGRPEDTFTRFANTYEREFLIHPKMEMRPVEEQEDGRLELKLSRNFCTGYGPPRFFLSTVENVTGERVKQRVLDLRRSGYVVGSTLKTRYDSANLVELLAYITDSKTKPRVKAVLEFTFMCPDRKRCAMTVTYRSFNYMLLQLKKFFAKTKDFSLTFDRLVQQWTKPYKVKFSGRQEHVQIKSWSKIEGINFTSGIDDVDNSVQFKMLRLFMKYCEDNKISPDDDIESSEFRDWCVNNIQQNYKYLNKLYKGELSDIDRFFKELHNGDDGLLSFRTSLLYLNTKRSMIQFKKVTNVWWTDIDERYPLIINKSDLEPFLNGHQIKDVRGEEVDYKNVYYQNYIKYMGFIPCYLCETYDGDQIITEGFPIYDAPKIMASLHQPSQRPPDISEFVDGEKVERKMTMLNYKIQRILGINLTIGIFYPFFNMFKNILMQLLKKETYKEVLRELSRMNFKNMSTDLIPEGFEDEIFDKFSANPGLKEPFEILSLYGIKDLIIEEVSEGEISDAPQIVVDTQPFNTPSWADMVEEEEKLFQLHDQPLNQIEKLDERKEEKSSVSQARISKITQMITDKIKEERANNLSKKPYNSLLYAKDDDFKKSLVRLIPEAKHIGSKDTKDIRMLIVSLKSQTFSREVTFKLTDDTWSSVNFNTPNKEYLIKPKSNDFYVDEDITKMFAQISQTDDDNINIQVGKVFTSSEEHPQLASNWQELADFLNTNTPRNFRVTELGRVSGQN